LTANHHGMSAEGSKGSGSNQHAAQTNLDRQPTARTVRRARFTTRATQDQELWLPRSQTCERCYISAVTIEDALDPAHGTDHDPTLQSGLRPLRRLLDAMDDDIARLYAEHGVGGVRPRFSMALIRLHHRGPMMIRQLAEQIEVTHSAMSQTVTAMRRNGLVDSSAGHDARTRTVELTEQGRALVPFLEEEWRATERAWIELEDEVPYPLTRVVADLAAALEGRSFLERINLELGSPTAVASSADTPAAASRKDRA